MDKKEDDTLGHVISDYCVAVINDGFLAVFANFSKAR